MIVYEFKIQINEVTKKNNIFYLGHFHNRIIRSQNLNLWSSIVWWSYCFLQIYTIANWSENLIVLVIFIVQNKNIIGRKVLTYRKDSDSEILEERNKLLHICEIFSRALYAYITCTFNQSEILFLRISRDCACVW